MTNLITGIIGLAMVITFLAFMVVWLKEIPLTLIVVVVMVLAFVDFVQSLRANNGSAGR
jgi:heme/copper-type cytochrome/quinol oxidase subunit 4